MPIQFKTTVAANAIGKIQNMEEWNATSGIATGTIGFAVPVVAVGGVDNVAALTAAGQNVLGISVMEQFLAHAGDNYLDEDIVTIAESAVIGVPLGAAVTKGAQARYNVTAGNWTGAAASATVLTIPGAQFDEAGASGTVGLVRFRRPVPCVSA